MAKYEEIALYLAPIHGVLQCTCKVVRDEDGNIILPDPAKCAFVEDMHRPAIQRAVDRLNLVPKREIES